MTRRNGRMTGDPPPLAEMNDKLKRSWAKRAAVYDRSIGFFEARVFGPDHRAWASSQAAGQVLEVAIGTGLNLPYYPPDVELTGVDLSPEMLAIAAGRAAELGRAVALHEGDAHDLPLEDRSFDTAVCTYSLCNIPDPRRALAEMHRVLRPGGRLLLVDHIASDVKWVFWFQKAVEFVTARLEGEHMTRRPAEHLTDLDVVIEERERLGRAGIVERVAATKPA